MRKAQLQIMENTFILIIVFLILSIALIYVMVMRNAEQKDKLSEFKDIELIKKSQILNFLPEMQCSDNNNLDPDCYDILKMVAFRDYLEQDKLYYRSLLGNIKIRVVRYDPSPEVNSQNEEWVICDFEKPESNGYREIQYPVLLKDVIANSNYFGIIYLGVYE